MRYFRTLLFETWNYQPMVICVRNMNVFCTCYLISMMLGHGFRVNLYLTVFLGRALCRPRSSVAMPIWKGYNTAKNLSCTLLSAPAFGTFSLVTAVVTPLIGALPTPLALVPPALTRLGHLAAGAAPRAAAESGVGRRNHRASAPQCSAAVASVTR